MNVMKTPDFTLILDYISLGIKIYGTIACSPQKLMKFKMRQLILQMGDKRSPSTPAKLLKNCYHNIFQS